MQKAKEWKQGLKGYYHKHTIALNQELKGAIPVQKRRDLHTRNPWKHAWIAIRQCLLLMGLPLVILHFPQPVIWIPSSILLGFVVFSFTVLLHEALHQTVFSIKRPRATRILGLFYGLISGLSSSQFTKWHLDHHDELGSSQADPKRFYLSPKKHKRWFKLLYFSPVLFPIYFRAAAKAQKTYEPELRKTIKTERLFVIGLHLLVLGTCLFYDSYFALKAYIIPVFFIFPIAFALNRLGQHYMVDPEQPANWSTLVKANPIWNFLFLFSSYHLEHHYFPSVPFYNLKKLQKELQPFYRKQGIKIYGYTELLKLWLIDNHVPHTKVP